MNAAANSQAVRLLIAALPERERRALVAELAGEPRTVAAVPHILRRAEAAARLAVTPRTVDAWARRGLLPKVRLPGRTRAVGFRASDIDALVTGEVVTHDK
jgi:predicted DNA-binding transcriptional regulator AlpA